MTWVTDEAEELIPVYDSRSEEGLDPQIRLAVAKLRAIPMSFTLVNKQSNQ